MVGVCGHGFTEGGLTLLPLRMTSSSTSGDRINNQTIGCGNNRSNKVVLLLGDNLTNKASIKDAFVNYIFAVQATDAHRLILVDDHTFEGSSSIVRVYTFNQTHNMTLPFNLVLVDIPPLGSFNSAERDVRILQDVEDFLLREFRTTLVDCVGLVAPSSSDVPQSMINTYRILNLAFDKLQSITQVLVIDSRSYMALLTSLKRANIEYSNLIIFDNGDAADHINSEEHFFTHIFSHFDYHGVNDFFQEMRDLSPLRLSLGQRLEAGSVDISDISRLRMIHQFTEVTGIQDGLELRQVMMELKHRDEASRTEWLTLGPPNEKPTKVVLLAGDRGSGKTTLITAMINYIFNVELHDDFRLLIDGDPLNRLDKNRNIKKTNFTTAYTFYLLPKPLNLTILDTPGLGTAEEQVHNKNLISRCSTLLRHTCGLPHLDIIGLVATARTEKLPDSYRSVYKHLYSLLTDEGGEKILILATQSDAKRPAVLQALEKLGLPFSKGLKFNSHTLLTDLFSGNSATYTERSIAELYWEIERRSLNSLFAVLQE